MNVYTYIMQYDMVFASAMAVLSVIGGVLLGFSSKISYKSGRNICGLVLCGISVIGTMFLGYRLVMNFISGIAAYSILSMADAWIGSSMVSIAMGNVGRSLVATIIAVLGLIVSTILVVILKRKTAKQNGRNE